MIYLLFLILIILIIYCKNHLIYKKSFLAIDFSPDVSLHNDDRVHELHKMTYPDFCHEYVLWRVNHDGSCWNSVGITLLFYHMIQGGEEIFDNSVKYLKNILSGAILDKNDRKLINNFFIIINIIRRKMDHRLSLELRNNRNTYEILDRAFRIILATHERQKALPDHDFANDVEQPKTRGHMSYMRPLLTDLGFSYAEIDCYEHDNQNIIVKADFEEYIELNNNIINNLPDIIAFGSSPGYADVAVRKSFSKIIKKNNYKQSPIFFDIIIRPFNSAIKLLSYNHF